MRASKFEIGDPVVTIKDGEIRKGVVYKTFDQYPMMIVEFEDGSIEKVAVSQVAPEPKAEPTPEAEDQVKEERGPVEDSAITITPEKFLEVVVDAVENVSSGDALVRLVLSGFISKLYATLFMGESEGASNA